MDFNTYKEELAAKGFRVTGANEVISPAGEVVAGVGAYRTIYIRDGYVQDVVDGKVAVERARNAKGHFKSDDPATPEDESKKVVKTAQKKRRAVSKKKEG